MQSKIIIISIIINIMNSLSQIQIDSTQKGYLRKIDNIVPRGYFLEPARVNPFGAVFGTKFGIPDTSWVKICVTKYDLNEHASKELICTIFNNYLNGGIYEVKWFLVNDLGEAVESGAYMLQIESNLFNKKKNLEIVFIGNTLLPFYLKQ